MTTIRATCDTCGDVNLIPSDVSVEIRGEDAFYHFYCPVCDQPTVKAASPRVQAVLAAVGVRDLPTRFADELDHSPYIPVGWMV